MDWGFAWDITPDILNGLSITLRLFAWSLLFSTIGGIVLGLMRISPIPPFRWFSAFFGWFIRGLPLLLIMFYVFFALPEFSSRLTLSSFDAAVVGLTVWTAAYQSEAVRSGIISVDAGQFEAAEALAMTRSRYMRKIILPQSARIILPPFIGNAINTMKQTSLATAITVPEMTLLTNRIIAREFIVIEPLVTLAIIFLLLTTILVLVQTGLERVFRLKA